MDILFVGDKEFSGDEIPERVVRVYETSDGSQVHITLTEEGVIMDRFDANGEEVLGTWAGTPDEINHILIFMRKPEKNAAPDIHQCDDCKAMWGRRDLNEIADLKMRLDDGGEAPSGECPKCGALCYPRRIVGKMVGDFTGYEAEFDATKDVLAMNLLGIQELRDHDYSSDHLAPAHLVEGARKRFREQWGDGSGDILFGFEVEIEEALRVFFGVAHLEDIAQEQLEDARRALKANTET